HVLLVVLHHIAGDGWSMAPLWRDIAAAYEARRRGAAPALPALPVQYADYTLWQHEVLGRESEADSLSASQLAFWTTTLAGLPDHLQLPSDHPRPARSSYRGGHVPLKLDADLHQALMALARESSASLFMLLQAGLAALLTRLGGGNDIPIGSPIAGRTDSALDELVGLFINTLVLRTDTSGNPSFRDLVKRVRATNLAAYAHQDLPFERLVEVLNPERSLSRHPLFQVVLAMQNNAPVSFTLPDLDIAFEPIAIESATVDLWLSFVEHHATDGMPQGIDGLIKYAVDLFDRTTIEHLGERLIALLRAATAAPELAIERLDLLSAEERQTVLQDWNATTRSLPDATLPE